MMIIASRGIGVNGRTDEQTTRKHKPLAFCCWQLRLNITARYALK